MTGQNTSFLVDSQADICVLKRESIRNNTNRNNTHLDTTEIIEITGVSRNPIYTLGTTKVEIQFNKFKITHKFHIVPNEFNIPSQGIIGRDFNTLYNCILNYGEQTYTIATRLGTETIQMKMHTQNNYITLPPRAETTRIFKFSSKNPTVIKSKELGDGVLTSNGIAINGTAAIKIINCTEEVKMIKMPKFETESLKNYKIYTMNQENNNETRTNKLLKMLSKQYPKEKQIQRKLDKLCTEYADIFALNTDKMTVNNFYTQKLKQTDNEPVYTKNYRTAHSQKEEVNRQVKKLLDNDLIENSTANYNSPIILVPKKGISTEKKWRMCIDYRKLNEKLIADRHPLPRIDDILDSFGRAKYFSVIDLYSGFHQVPLEENSRDCTTFSTEKGSYRWKVLPFGLNISPNSFSRMMNIAFAGLPPEKAFLYIDDIIVIGRTENEHLANLESVFKLLRYRNLKLNAEKCRFFQHEVTFLGHKCTSEGILPDNSKINSIKNYPRPHDKDPVKRFVAFANYYRKFINNFAEMAQPLSKLTSKKSEFIWNKEHQNAFEMLKNKLMNPQILQYPDFTKEFIIKVDASSLGCAGVLLQENKGIDMPVAYFSRTFQKGEQNKAIIEKELLAIHHSILAFRPYVYGKKFTVYTDHKPLIYLFTMKNPTSKLVRIKLELSEYNFDILHIKGKDNIQADALSRIPFSEIQTLNENNKQVLAITRSMTRHQKKEEEDRQNKKTEIETEQNEIGQNIRIYEKLNGFDRAMTRIKSKLDKNDNLWICAHLKHKQIIKIKMQTNGRLSVILSKIEKELHENNINEAQLATNDEIFNIFTVDEFINECLKTLKTLKIALIKPVIHIKDKEEQQRILKEYHFDRMRGGHIGRNRLYAKTRAQFYWKNMSKDIAKLVRECKNCKMNKPRPATREPMALTPTPQKAFDVVIMDTIGPMQKTIYGNIYAITLICDLTKYLISISIPNKEANTVAKAIFENFMLIYGIPKSIRTDLGTEYKNEIIKELSKLLNIQHNFSTAYHHETLGSIERTHRTFNEYLRSYSNNDTWDIQLRYFTFCYNTSYHTSLNHKYTPFELVFGRKCNEIEFLNDPIQPIYNIDSHIKLMKNTLQQAHEKARKFIDLMKIKNKKLYDNKINQIELNIGDLILVKKEPYDKFKPIFSGPYKVRKIEDQNIVIEINKNDYKIHKNRTIKF